MTSFPRSPRLVKGGLALLDPQNGTVLRIISLQYNPDTLTRSFKIKGVDSDTGDRVEALRLKGPPVETIKLDAEIDATDQLEVQDPQIIRLGLHPMLASLEILVYPNSATLEANNDAATAGTLEIIPMETALIVFIFGPNRIIPIRITELSITEEAFDTLLNPIRAKISLGMRVLTIDDIGFNETGGGLFMSYLRAKEQLSAKNRAGTIANLGVTGIPIG